MTPSVPDRSPRDAADALAHFAARLRFEADAEDVAHALASAADALVLIDARSSDAYQAGHIPGARLLPRPLTREDAASLPPSPIVVYCWGPGCNGAVRLALELARLGRPAREMLGGFEYWVREGHPIEGTESEAMSGAVDPHGVVKLKHSVSCLC